MTKIGSTPFNEVMLEFEGCFEILLFQAMRKLVQNYELDKDEFG